MSGSDTTSVAPAPNASMWTVLGLVSANPPRSSINDPASVPAEEAHTHEQARCCSPAAGECRASERRRASVDAMVSPEGNPVPLRWSSPHRATGVHEMRTAKIAPGVFLVNGAGLVRSLHGQRGTDRARPTPRRRRDRRRDSPDGCSGRRSDRPHETVWRHRAVDDVTFRLDPGGITGFLGPNGAGKTTTLRVLLGLAEPTSGQALVVGRRYRELEQPLRHVGAVLESDDFHPAGPARTTSV